MQTGEETMALVNAPSLIMHVDVCMVIQNKDWEKQRHQLMPKSQNVCGCVHD